MRPAPGPEAVPAPEPPAGAAPPPRGAAWDPVEAMQLAVHDLKSPLTAVLATLEMLADGDYGPLAPAQVDALQVAQARAGDLLSRIDALLEVARLDAGAGGLQLASVDPAEVVRALVDDWASRFAREAVRVEVRVAAGLAPLVADAALLGRVLDNLVRNAVEHSAGPLALRLEVAAAPDGTRFSVGDDGPGIAPEHHAFIFERFARLPGPGGRRVRSSGLGLAFCRMAMAAHRGRIWVDSAPGAGSTFHVVFPHVPAGAEGGA